MRAALVALLLTGALASSAAAEPEYKITDADLARLEARMQRQVGSMQYLMNPYQLRQFFALADDEARRAWITRFWAANDPTPTTPVNEMKTEHYLRADIARAEFARTSFPGFDRRGEVLIRYGFPDYRGRIDPEVTARKVHAPGELWFYKRHDMVVQFRDESLKGNFEYAITPFGDAQDITPDLAEFLIYDTQSTIQEKIPEQYLEFYRDPELNETGVTWGAVRERFLGLEPERYLRPRTARTVEGMDEIVDPDWTRSLPNNPAEVFHQDQAEKMATNFQSVLEDTPSSYPFNFAKTALTFFFDVGQFRAGEGVNRVEVNVEFPVEPGKTAETKSRRYVATATVYGADWNIVEKMQREVTMPVSESSATRLMPAQLAFSLPRNYYRVAVDVAAPDEGLASAYRTSVPARNYDKDLAISDILFAQKIAPLEAESPFARGALEVIPHPIRRYAVGSPVSVYFEVYNLGHNPGELTSYDVEYRVVEHNDRKQSLLDRFRDESPAFSSRFEGSGYTETETLHLAIQTANLKPGFYDFIVRVKDEYWQSETLRRATFRIVKPSEKE